MTDDPSRRIGDYEVLGVLGSGGMGKVFKVRNVISDRVEAMKVLLPDLAGRQELADRFLREIKLLASLDHPNIAQLRTALTLSNRLVMVMEYVEGTTLAERLEQGPIPAAEALGYVTQVLNALSYAHSRNVIHRDIKPANMMLTPNGTVKLMDFGIARASGDASMTVTGTTVGSLFYMSPEQVKGAGVDARSDLYSLGVSIYEMVTGVRPFKADSDYSLMTAQLLERPKPPSELRPELPGQMNGIILHSMAKEPAERFQSADEFRTAIDALIQSIPALAAPARTAVVQPSTPAPAPPMAALTPTPIVPPIAASVAAPPPAAATSILTGSSALDPVPAPSATSARFTPVAMPQPTPSVMQMSPKPSKGRGLYMALGAVIVLVVLVLAGISLPRMLKTRANEQKAATDQSAQTPSQTPNAQTANPPSTDANSAGAQSSTSQPATSDAAAQPPADSTANNASTGTAAQGTAPSADANASTAAASNMAANASTGAPSKSKSKSSAKKGKSASADATGTLPADQFTTAGNDEGNAVNAAKAEPIEDVEADVDQTASRATAASASIDSMRHQLTSQGLNLRGDIASAQELMKTNLDRAQQALQNHDTKSARRYLNMAQANMEKIEKFLGH
jgi:serine/threonine-protein kinase